MIHALLRPALAGLALTISLLLTAPVLAAPVNLKADLTPGAEVPPVSSQAKGSVTATYDPDTKTLTWKGTYSGLSGPAFAAHFHAGEPGKNGGIVIPIFAGADKAGSPFEGKTTLTDTQAADLLAGKLYVNVHTETHRPGELRGQLTK